MKIIASIALIAAGAMPALAQRSGDVGQFPRAAIAGIGLHYGAPQGDFANNVNAAFGVNGFFGGRLGSSPIAIRADLGYSLYGSETRRVPLGNGPLGLINVDVNTTNNILAGGIGMQAGLPGSSVTPFVGGSIGFSYFFTESSVSGSHQTTNDAFASSTNYSDGTFAKTLYGGFYIPIGTAGNQLELSARYHFNGEAKYLTEKDITFDQQNNPVLTPHRSRADLLTITVGWAFGRR